MTETTYSCGGVPMAGDLIEVVKPTQDHLAHLACSALFLLEASLLNLGKDTRPNRGDK